MRGLDPRIHLLRKGGYPTNQYFDLFLLIDNEHGRVTEWTADGKALELNTA